MPITAEDEARFSEEAAREVDAIAPAAPSIAENTDAPPASPQQVRSWARRDEEEEKRRAAQAERMAGGYRPEGARFDDATQEFVLLDGRRVSLAAVQMNGWTRVLSDLRRREETEKRNGH